MSTLSRFSTLSSGFVTDRMIEELTTSIRSGVLAPGTRIQSEVRLARRYKISVVSVRRALARLEAGGWIYRVAGSGTFVARQEGGRTEPGIRRALTAVFYSPLIHEPSATPYMWFLWQQVLQGMLGQARHVGVDLAVHYLTPGFEKDVYDDYPFQTIPGDGLIFILPDLT